MQNWNKQVMFHVISYLLFRCSTLQEKIINAMEDTNCLGLGKDVSKLNQEYYAGLLKMCPFKTAIW